MKKYTYICDMGSLKIMFEGGSCFFSNNIGDGEYEVYVCDEEKQIPKEAEFVGHFTIFKKGWLMYSDCDNENKQHAFNKGRYFVSLDKNGNFYIYKQDKDINA